MGAGRGRQWRRLVLRLVAPTLAAVLSSPLVPADPPSATVPPSAPVAPVVLALLQPDPAQAARYAAAGVDEVTLEFGWDAYEPARGRTDTDYLTRRVAEARTYDDAGLGVVLDLGLQYPPAWSFDLPGETRFVDQHGQTWHGETGTDPLNAVWNPAARQAQREHVHRLAADLEGLNLAGVRVGGLLSGEIRLPPARHGSSTDSLWGFDAGAVASSPVPGWAPGTGTPDQAALWLDHYLQSLTDYAVWLTAVVLEAFPGVPVDVLMPGWALRDDDVHRTAAALLSTEAVESTGDDLSGGLDWDRMVPALAEVAAGTDLTLVTTWIDAPSYGTAPRDQAPVELLARLAAAHGLRLAGENTGGGGLAALDRTVSQATRYGATTITWMGARQLGPEFGVELDDLAAATSQGQHHR